MELNDLLSNLHTDEEDSIFVFGYGSLIWKPDFPYISREFGLLSGYERCFCIRSVHHRGTNDCPGLVLGLKKGDSCSGMLFRIPKQDCLQAIESVYAREMVTKVYRPLWQPVLNLQSRSVVMALTFCADPHHDQYSGTLSLKEQAKIINHAQGLSGTNYEYLLSTVLSLHAMDIPDSGLDSLLKESQKQQKRSQENGCPRSLQENSRQ